MLGWALAIGTGLAIVYGIYDKSGVPKLDNNISALYHATHRTAWGAAVCWVIIACATGNGGKSVTYCVILEIFKQLTRFLPIRLYVVFYIMTAMLMLHKKDIITGVYLHHLSGTNQHTSFINMAGIGHSSICGYLSL